MGADMQALRDLRQLRSDLQAARKSKLTEKDRTLPPADRKAAARAFGRARGRIYLALLRLESQPMQVLPKSEPALAVFENMLATIDKAEAALRRIA